MYHSLSFVSCLATMPVIHAGVEVGANQVHLDGLLQGQSPLLGRAHRAGHPLHLALSMLPACLCPLQYFVMRLMLPTRVICATAEVFDRLDCINKNGCRIGDSSCVSTHLGGILNPCRRLSLYTIQSS